MLDSGGDHMTLLTNHTCFLLPSEINVIIGALSEEMSETGRTGVNVVSVHKEMLKCVLWNKLWSNYRIRNVSLTINAALNTNRDYYCWLFLFICCYVRNAEDDKSWGIIPAWLRAELNPYQVVCLVCNNAFYSIFFVFLFGMSLSCIIWTVRNYVSFALTE